MAVEPDIFKAVMGQWPSGVTVITTVDDDGPAGMTASSFSSVSLDPPLVSICVARPLGMHARLEKSDKFAVNILSKESMELGQRFAGMLRDVTDRFAGIETTTAETGSPILKNVLGWVDCRTWAKYDGGDHTIFVGEVLAAGIDKTASPLLYHSRSWGQFADVLAGSATITHAGCEADAAVVENAFGKDSSKPDSVEAIVARVQKAIEGSKAKLLVLDDAAGASDPLLVRLVVQAIAGVVGKTAVCLRPAAGPMALANIVVALKSGIKHISVSPEAGGAYVSEHDVRTMLWRMGVEAH